MNYKLKTTITTLIAIFVVAGTVQAVGGTLTPSGTAGDDTQYTLNDIYAKITADTDATIGSGTMTVPTGTPTASFRTLTEIYNALPDWQTLSNSTTTVAEGFYEATDLATVDTDLTASNIKDGTTIFGVTGTLEDANNIPSQTLSAATTSVPYGVYATTTLDAVDTDLTASNIKDGTTIFGVEGTLVEGSPALEWSTAQGSMNWSTAVSTCAGTVDGSTGWRLPTAGELAGAIGQDWMDDGDGVGDTFQPHSTNYWSNYEGSSTIAYKVFWNENAFLVGGNWFGKLEVTIDDKVDSNAVLCVR